MFHWQALVALAMMLLTIAIVAAVITLVVVMVLRLTHTIPSDPNRPADHSRRVAVQLS
jgi:hypothetical protein